MLLQISQVDFPHIILQAMYAFSNKSHFMKTFFVFFTLLSTGGSIASVNISWQSSLLQIRVPLIRGCTRGSDTEWRVSRMCDVCYLLMSYFFMYDMQTLELASVRWSMWTKCIYVGSLVLKGPNSAMWGRGVGISTYVNNMTRFSDSWWSDVRF